MPNDIASEKYVLSAILVNPTCVDQITNIIRSDDFYDDSFRKIWDAFLELYNDETAINPQTIRARMIQSGTFESAGGLRAIADLLDGGGVAAHVVHYANIVRSHAIRRHVIRTAEEAIRSARSEQVAPEALIDQSQNALFEVSDRYGTGVGQVSVGVLSQRYVEHTRRVMRDGVPPGISTGIESLNDYIQWRPGEVTVLAARPSQGKSAMALNFAEDCSIVSMLPTMFVSLEMSDMELANRFLSARSGINSIRLKHGTLTEEEFQRLVSAAEFVNCAPLTFVESVSLRMSQIASMARTARRAGNCELLVIDYMQLILPERPKDPREQQVAKISRSIKALAKELRIPVMVLAQVNRNAGDAGRPPKLSELRESGSIEQDADNVLFVHRPAYYMQSVTSVETDTEIAKIHIAKQRSGPTGAVEVVFDKTLCKFSQRQVTAEQNDGDIDF